MTLRKWCGLLLATLGLIVALWGAWLASSAPILAYIDHVAGFGTPTADSLAVGLKGTIANDYLWANWLLVIGTALQIAGAVFSGL